MFANGPLDWASVPHAALPKAQKWYLMRPCLTLRIIRYGSRVKWSNLRKREVLSSTPRCSSYWKREPSDHPRLRSPTLLLLNIISSIWSSSSSSCRAISTDIPDPFSPPLPITHRFWQVLRATPHILTELLYVGSSWSPCFCSAMWRGPQGYITYELFPTSPAVSCMSGSSNLDSFRDGW